MDRLSLFREIWSVDFEFTASPGARPNPLCCVARELRTGRLVRVWLGDGAPSLPPFGVGTESLFVAYYASAELGCLLALGWPLPVRVLDLFVEFRNHTSGIPVPCGNSLLGALAYHRLDGLCAAEKEAMRQLAMRGGDYSELDQLALLDYCQTDVDSLVRLLPAMMPHIDLPRALLRGRYMAAAARMEWTGVPLDTEALARLRASWERIKDRLIVAIDEEYGVFVPMGQRTINPQTVLGSGILQEAAAWEIDAHRLADAIDWIWEDERQANAELHAARREARKATGLTRRRIGQWENSGRDHSLFPGLDVTARELAGANPALGIGPGYTSDGGADDTDHAGLLWEKLRTETEEAKPKHHPDILRRAAEMVSASPDCGQDYAGPMAFSRQRWASYLARKGIPWPRLPSGDLALDDDTFREMARAYPDVAPIRELRHCLSQLRLNDLPVGSDGRNRCLLSAFSSRTGRNQPSNSKYIFGPAVWLRSLIRPEPGMALAYVDYEQQEFAIGAALSGDRAMKEAYQSGDPYLAFAKQAGAVPADATKATHKVERDLFKTCALGVQYGMQAESLARRMGKSVAEGREQLHLHKQTYPAYWRWSDAVQDFAMLHGYLQTVFGWRVPVGPDANPRSLRNFPLQANGAEMLRLACCLATERGIRVCAPVHDALLVEGPADEIENVIVRTQAAMCEASMEVTPVLPLRTEAKIVRYPDRYMDERGRRMWETVWRIQDELDEGQQNEADLLHARTPHLCVGATRTCCADAHPSPLISLLSYSPQE